MYTCVHDGYLKTKGLVATAAAAAAAVGILRVELCNFMEGQPV